MVVSRFILRCIQRINCHKNTEMKSKSNIDIRKNRSMIRKR